MRDFTISIPKDKRPLYLRIISSVRDAIKAGLAEPGELLPSSRLLASQIGANRHTIMTALDQLVAEGWVEAEPRRGYRVVADLPTRFFASKIPGPNKTVNRIPDQTRLNPAKEPKIKWDFRSSRPDLRLFPYRDFKTSLNESMRRVTPSLLDYGKPLGHEPFIRELQRYLRRVRALAGRDLIVTHGSQEAIFIASQILLKADDGVAVERICYPAARAAIGSRGAKMHAVNLDAEGLDPDDLARLCRRRRIKLLYLTPLHQYPTTVTLSSPRRLAIYELAAKHGFRILEDDYDHEYHYRCQPLAPMAADDPAGKVIYVSTLSKVLFPSARLGFAVVPSGLLAGFARTRSMITTQNDALLQDAVARWMRAGGFQRHLNRTRRAYAARLEGALAALERHRNSGLPLSWRTPDGGMAIWLETPWNSEQLATAAAKEGIIVQPESIARMDGRAGNHLRLGFAGHTNKEMEAGLEVLFQIGQRLPKNAHK